MNIYNYKNYPHECELEILCLGLLILIADILILSESVEQGQ